MRHVLSDRQRDDMPWRKGFEEVIHQLDSISIFFTSPDVICLIIILIVVIVISGELCLTLVQCGVDCLGCRRHRNLLLVKTS